MGLNFPRPTFSPTPHLFGKKTQKPQKGFFFFTNAGKTKPCLKVFFVWEKKKKKPKKKNWGPLPPPPVCFVSKNRTLFTPFKEKPHPLPPQKRPKMKGAPPQTVSGGFFFFKLGLGAPQTSKKKI
ncbi:hypothetical protein HYI43_11190 [Staphylococcus taiwanensis]|nr:hypothetical protein HYI43_11190 [Staphylococcus taiwanensis]